LNDFENKILEHIQNRHRQGESTASLNIHIRFGNEIDEIELVLEEILKKDKISKYYDSQYQENRYIPSTAV